MSDALAGVNKLFASHFDKRPTRSERLEGIQDDIRKFNPSLVQGWDLINAVLLSWAEEYPAHRLSMVEEEARALKIAVEEAAYDHEAAAVDEAMANLKDGV